MHFSVVQKMVIGFAGLALLLIITSVFSYIGLNDIKRSAVQVAEEKMPIQRMVSNLNVNILRLGSLTTNAFFAEEKSQIERLKTQYDEGHSQYSAELQQLSKVVSRQNSAMLEQIVENSKTYFSASEAMFEAKLNIIEKTTLLNLKTDAALNHADEASALMLDITYLEDESSDLETLIGMSVNIDNKLGLMLTNIRDMVSATDAEIVEQTIGNLEYNTSNVAVDVDFAKRIAQSIDDQGIFDSFDEEYVSMKESLEGKGGAFALKREQLALFNEAKARRADANQSIQKAINDLTELSAQANKTALEGQQTILDAVQTNVMNSFVISFIGIIATVVLAIIATRSIAKPLRYVNEKLKILSSGDLTQTLNQEGKDEFASLATSVNHLILALRTLIGSILEKQEGLSEAMFKSIKMGDRSLQQVAQQQSNIDSTSENTQQVKVTSQSNLKQIEAANSQIRAAITQSETVVSLVDQSKRQVNEQAQQAQRSLEIVNRVGENSQKIGGILDVIKTIADQTNLLALNAAIEAARAGEQGRGFAVVADEVRTLATRTHDSTEEIEKMIASLQQDAEQAVDAMRKGSEQVQKGVEITNEVTSQVLMIKELIQGLADFNQQIVQDTNKQDGLLDDVVMRLNTIVSLSQESEQSTRASNDAIHEIEGQMEGLSMAVQRFRVA